jgi:hypothetical protein
MGNIEITPLLPQILSDQSAVTMMWLLLTAKQTTLRHDFFRDSIFDLALAHQIKKTAFIGLPVSLPLFVFVKHLLSRSELGEVHVVYPANLLQEKREVVSLGESGELRNVIEAHIDDPFCSGFSDGVEEFPSRLLGEPDRKHFHDGSSLRVIDL